MVEFDVIYSMLFSGSFGVAGVDVTAGQIDSWPADGPNGGWFDEHEVVA
jgi:hypothetical protein